MKRITSRINVISARQRNNVWCQTTRTTPIASSGPTVLSLSLVKTVRPSRATAATMMALANSGHRLPSPRTTLNIPRLRAASAAAASGRSARRRCRRRLLDGRIQLADSRTEILEHEREPDRREKHGEEDDDRRGLLSPRRDHCRLRLRRDLHLDALLRRHAVRVLLIDDVPGEHLASDVRELYRPCARGREPVDVDVRDDLPQGRVDDSPGLHDAWDMRPLSQQGPESVGLHEGRVVERKLGERARRRIL